MDTAPTSRLRLSDKHLADLALQLGCEPCEVEARLAARRAAQAYMDERMEREGHPFPRSFGGRV